MEATTNPNPNQYFNAGWGTLVAKDQLLTIMLKVT